ncbi:MAG: IclR family transcriptional regulator [Actinobacteria bacterium]|nr:IclR family transcriptional regulator [Actinomycetota bacterium]
MPAAAPQVPPTRALTRGLSVLEVLSRTEGRTLGISTLARQLTLDKATVARLLATLITAGYVVQEPVSRQYRLTGKILNLAHAASAGLDLLTLARPHLRSLRDRLNETVHLGVLEGSAVVYLDKLESDNSIRLVSVIGQTMPLNSTSLGKAMLAALPDDALEERLSKMDFVRRTERTICDPDEFRRELQRVRARGYATDDRETEPLGACVAAAIIGPAKEVVGAISAAGPHFRIRDHFDQFGPEVRATAQAVAGELGADGPP